MLFWFTFSWWLRKVYISLGVSPVITVSSDENSLFSFITHCWMGLFVSLESSVLCFLFISSLPFIRCRIYKDLLEDPNMDISVIFRFEKCVQNPHRWKYGNNEWSRDWRKAIHRLLDLWIHPIKSQKTCTLLWMPGSTCCWKPDMAVWWESLPDFSTKYVCS